MSNESKGYVEEGLSNAVKYANRLLHNAGKLLLHIEQAQILETIVNDGTNLYYAIYHVTGHAIPVVGNHDDLPVPPEDAQAYEPPPPAAPEDALKAPEKGPAEIAEDDKVISSETLQSIVNAPTDTPPPDSEPPAGEQP